LPLPCERGGGAADARDCNVDLAGTWHKHGVQAIDSELCIDDVRNHQA